MVPQNHNRFSAARNALVCDDGKATGSWEGLQKHGVLVQDSLCAANDVEMHDSAADRGRFQLSKVRVPAELGRTGQRGRGGNGQVQH